MGLLQECEGKTREFCGDLLQKCWDLLDARLFDVANQIENDTLRNRHYAVMQEVRYKSDQVAQQLDGELERQFGQFQQKKSLRRKPVMRVRPGSETNDSSDALEDSLAITQVIDRVLNQQQQALWQLNKRVSLLRGGKQCEDEDNPLGPSALLLAFQYAVREIDVDIRIRLIIYDVFGDIFRQQAGEFYESINQQLKNSGILPNLLQPGQENSKRAAAPANPAPVTKPENYSANEQRLDEILALLLKESHWPAHIEQSFTSPQSLSKGDYASAAVQMQRQVAQMINFDRDQLLDPSQVQGDYFQTLATFLASGEYGVNKDVLLSIELLTRIFDELRRDSSVPFRLRCILSYLYTPFVKLAISDRSFFLLPEHPGRRLLDTMVHFGTLWLSSQPDDRVVLPRLRELCKQLAYDLSENGEHIEHTQHELQDFLDNTLRRAELAERRSIQAQEGMEALDNAQIEAERLFTRSFQRQQVSRTVMAQLRGPCTDFLAFVQLKHGQGRYWTTAIRLLDGIALSVRSRLPREKLVQFQRGQQRMLNVVRQSLFDSGYRGVLARDLVKSVRVSQLDALKLLAEANEVPSEQAPEVHEPSLDFHEQMVTGQWYQFSDTPGSASSDNDIHNLKLAWIGSRADRFMFVDANGINRRLESAETLEAALDKGLVYPSALPTRQYSESILTRLLHDMRLSSLRSKFTRPTRSTQQPLPPANQHHNH